MAKTTRTCPACNEATITFTARNRKEVERYADWKIEHGHVCDACLKRQREAEAAKAAEANAEAGLPALQGTEKQIAWAERIRAEILGIVESLAKATAMLREGDVDAARAAYRQVPALWHPQHLDFSDFNVDKDGQAEIVLALAKLIRQVRDAGWWIDNRGLSFTQALREFRQPTLDALQGESVDEVVDDVTIKPADPVTQAVVEIHVGQGYITAKLPERRDDFRDVVYPLGYRWDSASRTWGLSVGAHLGTPEDRAAELMHKLLAAGFIVSCQRSAVREKAISASFEPVYPRWLVAMTRGRFAGWVRLLATDGLNLNADLAKLDAREDYYRQGSWYVRPGHYEALRDLAEIHGFRVSRGADDLLTQAQRQDEARLLADDLPEAPSATAQSQEPERHIPDGIDPELSDD